MVLDGSCSAGSSPSSSGALSSSGWERIAKMEESVSAKLVVYGKCQIVRSRQGWKRFTFG